MCALMSSDEPGVRPMSIKKMTMVSTACLIVCASAATAQTSVDKSFTAVSKDCNGIQWSDRALATYPTIASACQGVEERNGKTYVKFQGTLKRNVNRGEQLVVNFKDGGEVTLTPPARDELLRQRQEDEGRRPGARFRSQLLYRRGPPRRAVPGDGSSRPRDWSSCRSSCTSSPSAWPRCPRLRARCRCWRLAAC